MEEESNDKPFLLDNTNNNYNHNNLNADNKDKYNQINASKEDFNKNIWIKYQYKFIISLIISILFMVGFIISTKGIFDIKSENKNVMKEFNISNFYITNETCSVQNNIIIDSKKYYKNINNFHYSRNMIIFIGKIAIFFSLLLLGVIFYIKFNVEKEQTPKNMFLKFSFYLCLVLFIIELLLFNILLYSFLRLFDVINFLESNIKNNCILFIHWDYNERILKHLMKMIMILELLKICNLQILVYFLKQLIVLNNYFYKDNSIPQNNTKKPQSIQSNIMKYYH